MDSFSDSGALSAAPLNGKSPYGALAPDHELIAEFDSLIVLTRGLINQRLNEVIRQTVEQQRPPLHEILIDLSEAAPLTAAGRAALIDLDRYAAQRYLFTFIVAAPSEVRARVKRQCRWINWIG